MKVLRITLFVLSICILQVASQFPGADDEVFDLPGLTFKPKFRHYSGYLNSTAGRHLHYWFVESQNKPSQDPVVLWMNGGPGCSSVLGFLTELGPFSVDKNGKTLQSNKMSWNLYANVIFLEAPAGVGFSYKDDHDYKTNDDEVSEANYQALKSFFLKFPQFKQNRFFVAGESYGGIYVPTLSVRVIDDNEINFKGFAVGNGYLDAKKLGNSIIFFGYYHGLFGLSLWDKLTKYCCNGQVTRTSCNFVGSSNSNCKNAVNEAVQVIMGSGLNIYNLYGDCQSSVQTYNYTRSANSKRRTIEKDYYERKLMLKSLNLHNSVFSKHLRESPPCIDTSFVANWINQPGTRQNLHIPDHLPDWEACSLVVESEYTNLYKTMKPQILKLLNSNKNISGLIYNGDVDMACNFLGDEWFVDDLGLPLISDYKKWFYNKQIAGYFKVYQHLAFVTIRGAGHMVPEDKPGPALKLFYNFLTKPLIN